MVFLKPGLKSSVIPPKIIRKKLKFPFPFLSGKIKDIHFLWKMKIKKIIFCYFFWMVYQPFLYRIILRFMSATFPLLKAYSMPWSVYLGLPFFRCTTFKHQKDRSWSEIMNIHSWCFEGHAKKCYFCENRDYMYNQLNGPEIQNMPRKIIF